VPHCFRKHFPDEYKVHNWHDIVLLCDDCHNGYEEVAQLVKNDMLQIPEEEWQQRKDKLRAIKNAHTLVYHLDLIPESKKEHIRASLSEYLGVDQITDDQIIELALQDRPCLLTDEDWKRVIDNVEDLDMFVRWWRQHFLDTMTPEYLPQGWSVDSPTTRHDLDIVSGRITV
jgi:beta-glucosidase-like glycosyl hydrolase